MGTSFNDGSSGSTPGSITPPIKLAHIVLRTSRYEEMLAWYQRALRMRVVFGNEVLSFLTYDEEHHRLAILNMAGLAEQPDGICGVHHIAFTYDSMSSLMENYAVLRDEGVKPVYVINHGPTTSLYYADPDGNQLEFQVENFATVEEGTEFFYSDAFKENPIGVEFDPDHLLARVRAGESEEDLRHRPNIGKRGMEGVELR